MQTTGERTKVFLTANYVILVFLVILALFPFIWMFGTSFKRTYAITSYPPEFFPRNPTLSNYTKMLFRTDFFASLKNSAIVAGGVMGFLTLSVMAGYGFAKYRFPGRSLMFLTVLGSMMVPIHVVIVPLFIMIGKIRWINTYQALILPLAVYPLPVLLSRQYILQGIPEEMLDAARIDGCSEIGIFWRIVIPLFKPAAAAIVIMSFTYTWNNFLWPMICTTKGSMRTLPVALALLQAKYLTEWGLVMATAAVTLIPLLVVFLFFQRYFIQGISLTGFK